MINEFTFFPATESEFCCFLSVETKSAMRLILHFSRTNRLQTFCTLAIISYIEDLSCPVFKKNSKFFEKTILMVCLLNHELFCGAVDSNFSNQLSQSLRPNLSTNLRI